MNHPPPAPTPAAGKLHSGRVLENKESNPLGNTRNPGGGKVGGDELTSPSQLSKRIVEYRSILSVRMDMRFAIVCGCECDCD